MLVTVGHCWNLLEWKITRKKKEKITRFPSLAHHRNRKKLLKNYTRLPQFSVIFSYFRGGAATEGNVVIFPLKALLFPDCSVSGSSLVLSRKSPNTRWIVEDAWEGNSEDFPLLVAFLLVTFSWLFRGFFVALFCLEKQCSGLFRGFFVAPVLGKFYAYSPWNSLLRNESGLQPLPARCRHMVKGEPQNLAHASGHLTGSFKERMIRRSIPCELFGKVEMGA